MVASAMSQRGSFAGSGPKGVPNLHPMFKQNQTENPQNVQGNLENRFGETAGTTAKIPVDARGDVNLVNRLNEWPEENRPFWLTNYKIIEQNRGGSTAGPVVNNQNIPNQGQNVGSAGQPIGTGSQPNGGLNQAFSNRFGEGNNQPEINNNNSFSIIMNGQWRTYVYNPMADSWVRRV